MLQNFEESSNMAKNGQKMKKSLVKFAFNPFFGWFWVPKNLILGTLSSTTRERWYLFYCCKYIWYRIVIFWNGEQIFFFYSLNCLLASIMVNLKINSNLPLCIVKGNGRWNYREMQSRHKIKAESTQSSKKWKNFAITNVFK